jgi:hypothetical protein
VSGVEHVEAESMSPESAQPTFSPDWLPFALDGLPHKDAAKAWQTVLNHFPEIPGWPQLPRRSALENMYAQFSERFPGIIVRDGNVHVELQRNLDRELERLYLAYLEDDISHGRMGETYAAGLSLLRQGEVSFRQPPLALKGEITGPVSWGLTVVDQHQRPILYDEMLADAVSKHLLLKATWQERELRRHASQTILLLNEPYMASFGSAFVALRRNQVIGLIEEVLSGLEGLKGVHCCGNTDWTILLETSIDILSLDAYDYGDSLLRYADELDEFLDRGGVVAWGIVPASVVAESESVESLVGRLERTIGRLVKEGVSRERLLGSGLVTPSCGLGTLGVPLAEHILDLTVAVATEMRGRHSTAGVPDTDVAAASDTESSEQTS